MLLIAGAMIGVLAGALITRWVSGNEGADRAAVRSLLGHLAAIEATTRRLEQRVAAFEGQVVEQAKRIELLAAENSELRTQLRSEAARCASCVNFRPTAT